MRTSAVVLFLILLIPSVAANVPSGTTFGDMRMEGGRIFIEGDGSGEFVSSIFELDRGQQIRAIHVDATLDDSSSNIEMSVERSDNNFDTVAGRTKTYINESQSTYVIEDGTNERYRRLILRATGPMEITSLEIETNDPTPRIFFIVLVFLLTIIGGVVVMMFGQSPMESFRRRVDAKKMLPIAILLVLLLPFAGAALTEESYSSPSSVTNAKLTFEGLQPNTEYRIRGNVSGATDVVQSTFTTSQFGTKRVTFELAPLNENLRYTTEGWPHYLVNRNTTNIEETFFLYYGFDFHGLDTFNDGVLNENIFDTTAAQETGGELRGSLDTTCINVPLTGKESHLMSFRPTGGSTQLVLTGYEDEGCANNFNQFGINTTIHSEIEIDLDTEANELVARNLETGATIGTLPTTDEEVFIELNNHYNVEAWSVIPGASVEFFAFPSIAEFTSDANTMGNGQLVFDWNDVAEIRSLGTNRTLQFNDGSGFTKFLEDIGTSERLSIENTLNETFTGIFFDTTALEILDVSEPNDGISFTNNGPERVRFTYRVPRQYNNGVIILQVREEGTTDFTSFYRRLGISSSDEDCVIGTDVAIATDDCFDDTITLSGDGVEQFFEERTPDRYEWRVAFNNDTEVTSDTILAGDLPDGVTFTSEIRTFTKLSVFTNIDAIAPRDNATVTTTKPEFVLDAFSQQGGVVQLIVDGTSQKNWDFDGAFGPERLRVTLNETGLSEGTHTWRGRFVGDDGAVVQTQQRTLHINTSLANDVNFTFVHPPDGFETEERDLNLTYDVATSNGGTLNVFLNQDEVDDKALASGTFTGLQSDVFNIVPDEYDWLFVFEDAGTGHDIQSEISQFTVNENVEISAISPADDVDIDQPPIVFRANLSTTSAGTLQLRIDGEVEESQDILAGFEGQPEFSVTNISSGKHSWKFRFVSDSTGTNYDTEERTFDLAVGSQQEGVAAGLFATVSQSIWTPLLATNVRDSVILSGVAVVIAVMIGTMLVAQSGVIAISVATLVYMVFGLVNIFPRWTLLPLIILAGILFGRWFLNIGER